MGQQLIGRPVSQRSGFPTLNTPSSASAPDLSQYLGFTTAAPQQQQMPALNSNLLIARENPMTLGFQGFGGGFGRLPIGRIGRNSLG